MKLGNWLRNTTATLTLALGLFVGVGAAHAEYTCQPQADGTQRCAVGLRSEVIGATTAAVGGQRQSQWCWAASISTVLRYHGFEVSQRRIVAETFGQVVNMPGSAQHIVGALNRVWTDDHGRRFMVQADASSASPLTAAQDLAANEPLIIGTLGHAMVLTALDYTADGWGNFYVTDAVVRDPWPGRGRRSLAPQEWYGTQLLVRIRVTPLRDDANGGAWAW